MRLFLTYWLIIDRTLCASTDRAQMKTKAQNVLGIPYESVHNFLKLPPNLCLGEAIGVVANSKERIFVYTRIANMRPFEFDPNGKFVRELGEGPYGFDLTGDFCTR